MASDVLDRLVLNNEKIGIEKRISEQAFYIGELDFDDSFEVLVKFTEIGEPLSNAVSEEWCYAPFKLRAWFEDNQIFAKLAARRMTEEEYAFYLDEVRFFR